MIPLKIEFLKFPDSPAISMNVDVGGFYPKNEHRRSKLIALTKADLIKSICYSTELTRRESISTVDSFFEAIKRSLESGEDVKISGFGKFCVKEKKERKGRNPETGGDMKLRARRIVTFKCSNIMRDKINGEG